MSLPLSLSLSLSLFLPLSLLPLPAQNLARFKYENSLGRLREVDPRRVEAPKTQYLIVLVTG